MNDRITALEEALRTKAAMIELGEKIAWGSDVALMREAADTLAASRAAPDCQQPDLVTAAQHRSFPEAGDGRPMPPMGDDLMAAGLSAEDARFVAVQLAQNGLTLVLAAEPVAWRWRPKGSSVWIYDPKPEWLEMQSRDEIDAEPLYAAQTATAAQDAARVPEIAALIEAAEETLDEYWGQTHGPIIDGMKKIDAALRAIGGDA